MSGNIYHEDIKALANIPVAEQKLEQPDCKVTLDNPLCGDRITIALNLKDGCVTALTHQVKGCLLCRASANVIAQAVVGTSATDLEVVVEGLQQMLKGKPVENWPTPGWESLALFQPVAAYKSRHECVLLPFKAIMQALS